MTTQQKSRTRLFYSFVIAGRIHKRVSDVGPGSLNEGVLRSVEDQISRNIVAQALAQGCLLPKDEPSVFVYDFQPIKG
ncbi:hypothetical protein SAMN05216358_0141 [Rhizobium sp. AN5]|uniref:hypothetical protein n=1 Tax=Rhizobium sp. AN5 TaxID=1855304 RepID=UPI000BD09E29|nr:hypothetical protein [Rhizobium sp. AN5]SOC90117.1 hypothetical protein SAMN05216358_0141 [Rhizobium sp. AN5]